MLNRCVLVVVVVVGVLVCASVLAQHGGVRFDFRPGAGGWGHDAGRAGDHLQRLGGIRLRAGGLDHGRGSRRRRSRDPRLLHGTGALLLLRGGARRGQLPGDGHARRPAGGIGHHHQGRAAAAHGPGGPHARRAGSRRSRSSSTRALPRSLPSATSRRARSGSKRRARRRRRRGPGTTG